MRRQAFRTILILAVLASVAHADDWNKKFSVTGKPELRVSTSDGSVRVYASETREISVHVTTLGWRIADDQVRITDYQSGNRLELQVRVPRSHGIVIGTRRVEIEVNVPRESDLDIRTDDGRIGVQDVRGDLRLSSGDGRITASGLDGKLRAHTHDGSIRVDGRFDSLDLQTGDGRVEASAARGSKLGTGWSVRTRDGSVDVRLPQDLAATLDVDTRDGHISVDVPVEVSGPLGRSRLRGRMNGGGPTLQIHTGDGSIRIGRS